MHRHHLGRLCGREHQMNTVIRFFKRQKGYFWVYALITAAAHCLAYWLPDALARSDYRMLGSAFDEAIPVVPGFIYIYVGAYFFWIAAYAYYYAKSRALADRLFTADIICKAVGLMVYCLYPCTLKQAAPEEITGFGAWLMKLIYLADKPSKLLPSMHCYVSILLALPVCSKYARPMPAWLKIAFTAMAVAVCASTLFVKQHVFADVYTALMLAVAAWMLSLLLWRVLDRRRR